MDSIYLKALIADKNGNWDQAHDLIQDSDTIHAAWIHAYLHRKEGDLWNAQYWYKKANKPLFHGSLDEEWEALYYEFSK